MKTIVYSRVIHLSHCIDPEIPRWAGDPRVEFTTVAQIDTAGYYLRRVCIGEHSATHINAPNSFASNGVGIDAYGAESLVVAAIVLDISARVVDCPDYQLTIADVLDWERQQGRIPAHSLVLLYTGWQYRWHDPVAFLNTDAQRICHFPGFAAETTQFLLQERTIAGVGIDTHGVDGGQDTTFATNRLVLADQGIVLENLTNLDQLPAVGTTLTIGLLRLQGGSGSPAAVLALLP